MPKKILIIDDDPTIVKYLMAVFSDNGYATCSASSSMEGLDVVKAEKPDLICLDPTITPIANGTAKLYHAESAPYTWNGILTAADATLPVLDFFQHYVRDATSSAGCQRGAIRFDTSAYPAATAYLWALETEDVGPPGNSRLCREQRISSNTCR